MSSKQQMRMDKVVPGHKVELFIEVSTQESAPEAKGAAITSSAVTSLIQALGVSPLSDCIDIAMKADLSFNFSQPLRRKFMHVRHRLLVILIALLTITLPGLSAHTEIQKLTTTLPSFTYEAKEISQKCDAAIVEAEKSLKLLTLLTDDTRTFQNTVAELSRIQADFITTLAPLAFLSNVSPDEKIRDTAQTCEVKLDQFGIEVFTREDLFNAIQIYAQKKEKLSPLDEKLLEETLRDFKRNGLLQPKDIREKIITLKKNLVQLTSDFSKNIQEDKSFITVTREELEGLPDDYISRLEKIPDGKYKITNAYPDYFPFVRNAKSGDARDRLQKMMYNRAADKNVALLEEIIRMRAEIAHLLGYKTHAGYILELRMAKNPKQVEKFLTALRQKLKKPLKKDLNDMLELKRKYEDPKAVRITDADRYYYDEFARKLRYDVDNQKIKEYFPLEHVLKGIFEVYQQILGLHFQEIPAQDVWHPDVQVFEVRDHTSNDLIGYFYIDLFPREGKYGHAAMWDIVPAHILPDKSLQIPVATMVANFTKPSQSRPSLLTHDEVETFFHEFGHVMHGLLGHSPYIEIGRASC